MRRRLPDPRPWIPFLLGVAIMGLLVWYNYARYQECRSVGLSAWYCLTK